MTEANESNKPLGLASTDGLGAGVARDPGHADHWSDCATNNAPAYPAGPCDCMPTPAMCRAAVVYLNGPEVYEKLPREALEIEEEIYREVWRAMQAAAPNVGAKLETTAAPK